LFLVTFTSSRSLGDRFNISRYRVSPLLADSGGRVQGPLYRRGDVLGQDHPPSLRLHPSHGDHLGDGARGVQPIHCRVSPVQSAPPVYSQTVEETAYRRTRPGGCL